MEGTLFAHDTSRLLERLSSRFYADLMRVATALGVSLQYSVLSGVDVSVPPALCVRVVLEVEIFSFVGS